MKTCFLCLLGMGLSLTTWAQSSASFDSPVMGWSSWNTYRVNISDSLIMRQADAMVEKGLKDAGYQFINIDDGYFGFRDERGRLHTHPKRFPNGLKGVADHIHSLGLKAGIYSDAGTNTCGSIWDHDKHGIGVGLYGYERQDADLFFNECGFDFIKIDYCGAGQELNLDEEKRYRAIRQAIDEVAGKHVSINVCRWAYPGTWVKEVGRSWRISGDISANWNSVKYIIGKNMYLSAYAGNGHYNDMDMLEIGRGLAQSEEEVHFGMWCLMSSPLLIGCDLTSIPDASLQLLKNKELIALNQDRLGLQAYVAQHEGDSYVFVKDIEKKRGNVRAVALYNPSDTICDFNVPTDVLELAGEVKVRDLVAQKNLRNVKHNLQYSLQPHSVKILRLEAEKRIEPSLYEAEWGYMPLYNDLGKSKKSPLYVADNEASGKMKAIYIGGSRENYLEWQEVYSEEGGFYDMTIWYQPQAYRKLEVNVNNEKTVYLNDMEGDGTKEQPLTSCTIQVHLNPGYNVVRMGSSLNWAPDIDCFKLVKRVGL